MADMLTRADVVSIGTDALDKLASSWFVHLDAKQKAVVRGIRAIINDTTDAGLAILDTIIAKAGPIDNKESKVVKRIEVEEIILTSPNGKNQITLSANNDAAGIWLGKSNDIGPMIAIYTTKDNQTCVGLYTSDDRELVNIGLGESNGEPVIQFVSADNKNIITIALTDVMKLKEKI